MFENKRSDRARGTPKSSKVSLPKLPPLNTRNPFVDNTSPFQDDVSIGWTPVEERPGHEGQNYSPNRYSYPNDSETPIDTPHLLPKKASSISFPSTSAYSNSLKKHSPRRPPPPPISMSVPGSVPHTTASPTPHYVAPPIRVYKSPFIGEAALQSSLPQESPSAKVYRSPFVGDLDTDTGVIDRKENYSKPKSPSEGIPLVAFENPDLSTRALPPLPTPTTGSSGMKIESGSDIFNMKPPPVLGALRDTSNHSRLSDSIGSYYSDANYAFNSSSARHSSFSSLLGGKPLDQVPSITAPTQPFSIDSLDENKLYQCYSVYRLSDIYEWILKVYFEWFNEYIFGKIEFFQMVQLLLEFQMPKSFDQDTIDSNVDRIIESLVIQKAVRFELDINSEITIIVAGLDVSGIFTQLLPCYSFLDITYAPAGSTLCYSLTCVNRMPNERQEIKLSEIINKSVGVWTDYWKLTPEDIAEINPREVQKQSFIFDLIILEERSLNMANAAIEVYGKRFDPGLLPDEPDFAACAFDIFRPLIQLHKEFLLTPILWKLRTRGKFIDGVGKIYLKWCNEAREIYLKYAVAMATVHSVIAWEKQHETRFAVWLRAIDNSPEICRSKMYHDVIFFGGFFKSLQNLPITLNSILKNTEPSSEDYDYLKLVIVEVEKLSAEVDRVHGAAIDRRSLMQFSKQLVFRSTGGSNTVGYVNLATTSEGEDSESRQDRLDLGLALPDRRLLMSGMAMKKRELWLDPSPVYIVLLDNYFLITEVIIRGNQNRYKLAERPIPIDYLSLEERRKFDNVQSSGSSLRNSTRDSPSSNLSPIAGVRPNLITAASSVSKSIYNSATNDSKSNVTEISNASPDVTEFSFKIRNTATNESFTFTTTTLEECQKWKRAFLDCFTRSNQNNKVIGFDLQVLSTQFAFSEKEAPVNLPVAPEGSEIDVALKRHEKSRKPSSVSQVKPTSIMCSTTLELETKKFLLVATDYGVLLRNDTDPDQDFVKVLQTNEVKQMEVNVKLGLVFVLDNKILCYFNIASLLAAYYDAKKYLVENHIVGVVVSDKVGFFKFAEDFGNSRQLLYERKGRIFVLTPEFDRLTKLLKFFNIYKEYKIPVPNNSLSLLNVEDIVVFRKCFVVCTSKGVILYHDAFDDDGITLPSFLNDRSVLALLKHPHLSSNPFKTAVESSSKKNSSKQKMAEYVKKDVATNKTKPITCFQTPDSKEFLIVYDEAVIKIDQHGQIADWRSDILVLDFYCTGASFYEGYLTLVGDNLVQVYRIKDSKVPLGRMVPAQIIKGKKVRLLNTNRNSEPVVVLSHPNVANRQLVLEFRPR